MHRVGARWPWAVGHALPPTCLRHCAVVLKNAELRRAGQRSRSAARLLVHSRDLMRACVCRVTVCRGVGRGQSRYRGPYYARGRVGRMAACVSWLPWSYVMCTDFRIFGLCPGGAGKACGRVCGLVLGRKDHKEQLPYR